MNIRPSGFLKSLLLIFSLGFQSLLAGNQLLDTSVLLLDKVYLSVWSPIHAHLAFWLFLTLALVLLLLSFLWVVSALDAEALPLVNGYCLSRTWRGQGRLIYVGKDESGKLLKLPRNILEVWNDEHWIGLKQRTSTKWSTINRSTEYYFYLLNTRSHQLEGPFSAQDFMLRLNHLGLNDAKMILGKLEIPGDFSQSSVLKA